MAPRVSIIVPAFNAAPYLAAALDSALAQDWPGGDLKIVVVDDGSTDGTAAVIDTYRDRVVTVRRPNGGLCAAIGSGLERATGDLITFLDADDVLRPDKVRRQAEVLADRPGTGLVYSDLELMDADGRRTAPSFFAAMGITPTRGPRPRRADPAQLHPGDADGAGRPAGTLRAGAHDGTGAGLVHLARSRRRDDDGLARAARAVLAA